MEDKIRNMEYIRAYKFRIYPDSKRQARIDDMLILAQRLYNKLLEKAVGAHKKNPESKISQKTINQFLNEIIKEIIKEDKTYLELYAHVRVDIRNKLIRAYQNFFRRVKEKKEGKKAKAKLQKAYEYSTNQSDEYLHKLSERPVNSVYTSFAVENLHIRNMVKNHRLAQSIQNASWSKFTNMLSYKAESAGMRVIEVDAKDTTKTCSNCGNIQDMPLSERIYICNRCNMQKDRAINASINILKRGRAGLAQTNAQGDECFCPSTGRASSVAELRTYSAIAGEAPNL